MTSTRGSFEKGLYNSNRMVLAGQRKGPDPMSSPCQADARRVQVKKHSSVLRARAAQIAQGRGLRSGCPAPDSMQRR